MEFGLAQIHALAGYLVFGAGIAQFAAQKGGKVHHLVGRAYLLGWLILIVTGGILGSILITFLGCFGFYFVISAVRYAMVKGIPRAWFDKIQSLLGLLCGLAILVSAWLVYSKGNGGFAIIFLVFGLLFSLSSTVDIRRSLLEQYTSKQSKHPMFWYLEHYGRMIISFIAATTAFSAIQDLTGIVVINWLLPTVIGTVAIILMNRHYRRRFEMN
ncbi:hypothetical protein KFE98_18275 [bacterium SCSIO 12741]|nr:hypothetical protein KFE98_18275 [bacterium SCSIO 12741]